MDRSRILGVVFDKDGTLLDNHATWDEPFAAVLTDLAGGDEAVFARLCEHLGFDTQRWTIRDDSPFESDSNREFAVRVGALLGRSPDEFDVEKDIEDAFDRVDWGPPVSAPGAGTLLRELHGRGVPMAIATNDSVGRARSQMEALGWDGYFTAILGYDSGHPEKPDPAMVLAAAANMGLRGDQVAMVGDSATDVGSGRAAGAFVALVGSRIDLAPQADVVLGDIGDLLGHF